MIATLMKEVKPKVIENYHFENRDVSKLLALFAALAFSGFRQKENRSLF